MDKKDNPVNTTIDKTENMGFVNNKNEKTIPKALVNAVLPQLTTPASLRSKAKPKSWKERNNMVKPTTNTKIDAEIEE